MNTNNQSVEYWTIKPKPKEEPELPQIIFVSGKITGEKVIHCVTKFIAAKFKLQMRMPKGTVIVCPFDLPGIHVGISHKDAMKICLDFVENRCTGVFMLTDWTKSPGSRDEHVKAAQCGKRIIYESETIKHFKI